MSNIQFDPLHPPVSFDYKSDPISVESKPAMLTLEDLILDLQIRLNQDLRSIHGQDRASRRVDLEYLENAFESMSKNHNSIAWKHSIGFIGAVIGCFAAGFDKDAKAWTAITAISQVGKEGGSFAIAFNQSEQSKLQGLMEQLRDAISQDNKDDQEVQRLISQIDQTISKAYESYCNGRKTPFHPQ